MQLSQEELEYFNPLEEEVQHLAKKLDSLKSNTNTSINSKVENQKFEVFCSSFISMHQDFFPLNLKKYEKFETAFMLLLMTASALAVQNFKLANFISSIAKAPDKLKILKNRKFALIRAQSQSDESIIKKNRKINTPFLHNYLINSIVNTNIENVSKQDFIDLIDSVLELRIKIDSAKNISIIRHFDIFKVSYAILGLNFLALKAEHHLGLPVDSLVSSSPGINMSTIDFKVGAKPWLLIPFLNDKKDIDLILDYLIADYRLSDNSTKLILYRYITHYYPEKSEKTRFGLELKNEDFLLSSLFNLRRGSQEFGQALSVSFLAPNKKELDFILPQVEKEQVWNQVEQDIRMFMVSLSQLSAENSSNKNIFKYQSFLWAHSMASKNIPVNNALAVFSTTKSYIRSEELMKSANKLEELFKSQYEASQIELQLKKIATKTSPQSLNTVASKTITRKI